MTIFSATRGSPQGLPHLGPCGREKVSRGDGDGDAKPPAANLGTGMGTMLPAPHGSRIPAYIEFYLYTLISYNMYNINISINIIFY